MIYTKKSYIILEIKELKTVIGNGQTYMPYNKKRGGKLRSVYSTKKSMAKYILMHKTIPVVEITLDNVAATISEIGEIYDINHLPVGILRIRNRIDRRSFNNWWITRAIPASRMGIRDALFQMKISNINKLIEAAYGLSLSDQYWIKPKESDLEWANINFFENEFSEDVGEILLGKRRSSLKLVSPDNTSDGWLKKKWKIIDGKRYLIKCGSGVFKQEPYNEVIASIIAKRLEIYHIPYTLMNVEDEPYSVCENFVTTKTEYISAWEFMKNEKKENHISMYRHYLDCAKKSNINNMEDFLNKMIVLDYIMGNEDRHFGNFGVLRNAETLEYIGPAPVFDTGTSLYLNTITKLISKYTKIKCKPFKISHKEQLKLVTSFDWLDFSKLKNIEDDIKEVFKNSLYIENDRVEAISNSIREKIEELRILSKNHLAEDNIEYDLEENIQYFGEE